MKSIPALKDELRFLFKNADLPQWMIGINSKDFSSILPANAQDNNLRDTLVDWVYNNPADWSRDFSYIIDGGVDSSDANHTCGGRSRKMIGSAILTSGMIHVCQSEIYSPKQLAKYVGFSEFISSVKDWKEADAAVTVLADCRFLFISEVYIASDSHKTLIRSVAESFNDLIERRDNSGFVTIISIRPSVIDRIKNESDFLGSAITSLVNQSGDAGTILMKDKRLCRISF